MQETQKMIFRMKRRPVEEPIELLCKFTNLEIKTDNEYKPSRVQEDPFGFLQNQLKKFEITDTQRKSLYLKRIDVSKFKTICNDYIGDQKKQLLNEKKILSRNEIINANRFKTDHKSENKDQNIQNSILQSVMKQKQQIQKQLNINEDQIMQDEQQIENQDEKLSRNMKKFQYFKDLEAQEERIKNANIVLYNLNSHHEQLFCNNQPLEAESLINQVDYDYYILTSEQVQDQKLVQTVYFDKKFKLKPFEEEEMGDFIDEYPEQYKSESSKSYDPNDAEDRDSNHEDFADNDYPDEESSKGSKNSDEELDFKNNFMKRMNQKQIPYLGNKTNKI